MVGTELGNIFCDFSVQMKPIKQYQDKVQICLQQTWIHVLIYEQ